jgi:hypothetical protein
MRQLADPLPTAPRATIDSARGTVTATVDVVCPPERVYRMLVTAETERCWGTPEVYRMEEWRADLRVGGTWRVMVCMTPATSASVGHNVVGRRARFPGACWEQCRRGRSRSGGPRDDLGATKSAADEIGPPREPV